MNHILEIQKEPNGWRSFFKPTVLELLAYLEQFNNLNYSSFHYVEMTDELDVKGSYKDFDIEIYMENGGVIYLAANRKMPKEVFQESEQHFKMYKKVSSKELEFASIRFQQLAKGTS